MIRTSDFNNMNYSVQHSYYWRRGGQPEEDKDGSVGKVIADDIRV